MYKPIRFDFFGGIYHTSCSQVQPESICGPNQVHTLNFSDKRWIFSENNTKEFENIFETKNGDKMNQLK